MAPLALVASFLFLLVGASGVVTGGGIGPAVQPASDADTRTLLPGVAAPQPDPPAPFCRGLDCPRFRTVETSADFDVREYYASSWASTSEKDISYRAAVSKTFRRLFKYISGENVAGKAIPMTAPVLTAIDPGAGPNCKSSFNTSFFTPFALQDSPPGPSAPEVFLTQFPEKPTELFYVASFGGYANDAAVQREGEKLVASLIKLGRPFDDSGRLYVAGYDSPFRLFGRHNEVWIRAVPPPPPSVTAVLIETVVVY